MAGVCSSNSTVVSTQRHTANTAAVSLLILHPVNIYILLCPDLRTVHIVLMCKRSLDFGTEWYIIYTSSAVTNYETGVSLLRWSIVFAQLVHGVAEVCAGSWPGLP